MSAGLAYGFFGSNHGDVAITRGALGIMRAAGYQGTIPMVSHRIRSRWHRNGLAFTEQQDADIEVHSWDNALTTMRHGEPPHAALLDELLASPAMVETFAKSMGIAGVDRLFYCGGENLFSYGRPIDEWNMLGRLLPMFIAHARGARIIGLGATYGPYQTPLSRQWINRLIDIADLLVVRDLNSLQLLESLAGARPNLVAGLDSAFFVPSLPQPARDPAGPVASPCRIALVPRLDKVGLRVGLEQTNQRMAALKETGTQETHAFAIYRDLARAALSRGAHVDVYCQSDADIQLTDDLVADLAEGSGGDRVALRSAGRLETYHKHLVTADLVIASRLHSVIFAAQHSIPSVAVVFGEHGHKTAGVMKLLGTEKWCFDGNAVSADDIDSAAQAVLANRPSLAADLAGQVAGQKAQLLERVMAAG